MIDKPAPALFRGLWHLSEGGLPPTSRACFLLAAMLPRW